MVDTYSLEKELGHEIVNNVDTKAPDPRGTVLLLKLVVAFRLERTEAAHNSGGSIIFTQARNVLAGERLAVVLPEEWEDPSVRGTRECRGGLLEVRRRALASPNAAVAHSSRQKPVERVIVWDADKRCPPNKLDDCRHQGPRLTANGGRAEQEQRRSEVDSRKGCDRSSSSGDEDHEDLRVRRVSRPLQLTG